MKKIIIYPVVAAVLAGGLGFWGGMSFASSKASAAPSFGQGRGDFANMTQDQMRQRFAENGGGFAGRTGTRSGGTFGGMTIGEVLSKGGQSITVKMPDGSSRIVFYGDSTQVQKTVDGTMDEVTEGATVRVTGTSNDDGSVTAQEIQLMPEGSQTFFFGGPSEAVQQ